MGIDEGWCEHHTVTRDVIPRLSNQVYLFADAIDGTVTYGDIAGALLFIYAHPAENEINHILRYVAPPI